jgi:hypothetical protein
MVSYGMRTRAMEKSRNLSSYGLHEDKSGGRAEEPVLIEAS